MRDNYIRDREIFKDIYNSNDSVINNILEHQENSFYNECCGECSEFHECPEGFYLDWLKFHNMIQHD